MRNRSERQAGIAAARERRNTADPGKQSKARDLAKQSVTWHEVQIGSSDSHTRKFRGYGIAYMSNESKALILWGAPSKPGTMSCGSGRPLL